MKLTDPVIKSAKPKDKRYSLPDGNGLLLWVMPTGKKSWRYRYYYQGKEKMLSLGFYPGQSLKKAREELAQFKDLLARGVDPSINRQEQKLQVAMAKENSFESVARQWWNNWSTARTERHAQYVIRGLETDIFPVIGNKPVNELTAPTIVMTVKKIASRGALDIAKRALNTIGC